ncbi:MAG TPA: TetR/AcrR family transcriptional regulator [Candidatus Eisenbacteria bacterium]|nr:TetR/AcrR family transcriptional regulator [Candidatus Eisenbacteria bacterium]
MPAVVAFDAHSPRVRAKRERRRLEILRAALRAFRDRGYHQTTLDDIAARLDVRKSALYHYFPDKESILYECHRESLGELGRIVAEARDLATPRERLRHVIREHVRVMTNTLEGSPLAFEVTALSPERQTEIIAARDRYEREVRRLVEQGIREKDFRRVDAKVAAFAMLGAINWIARWYRPEGALQADTLGAQFADQMLDGLGSAGAVGRSRAGRAAPKRAARKERS